MQGNICDMNGIQSESMDAVMVNQVRTAGDPVCLCTTARMIVSKNFELDLLPVLFWQVLHHLYSASDTFEPTKAAVRELARVVRPGGAVMIQVQCFGLHIRMCTTYAHEMNITLLYNMLDANSTAASAWLLVG
eukprot:SAG31_NODE_402_length_16197_cov_5.262425_2_plen_133_part_00